MHKTGVLISFTRAVSELVNRQEVSKFTFKREAGRRGKTLRAETYFQEFCEKSYQNFSSLSTAVVHTPTVDQDHNIRGQRITLPYYVIFS